MKHPDASRHIAMASINLAMDTRSIDDAIALRGYLLLEGLVGSHHEPRVHGHAHDDDTMTRHTLFEFLN